MGVDRTDYLMLGVDVGYDAFDWDRHAGEVEGSPNARFDLVYDGMLGKYCVAGKIIAASDRYAGFEGRTVIDPADLGIDRDELARKISDAFGKVVRAGALQLMLFSHFS